MSFFLGHCSLPYKLQARTLTITYSNNSEICTHIYHFLSIKKQRYKKAVHTHTSELRSCVKVEVPSWAPVPNIIMPTVSVDVKKYSTSQHTWSVWRRGNHENKNVHNACSVADFLPWLIRPGVTLNSWRDIKITSFINYKLVGGVISIPKKLFIVVSVGVKHHEKKKDDVLHFVVNFNIDSNKKLKNKNSAYTKKTRRTIVGGHNPKE